MVRKIRLISIKVVTIIWGTKVIVIKYKKNNFLMIERTITICELGHIKSVINFFFFANIDFSFNDIAMKECGIIL